jgi:hypothetical protein
LAARITACAVALRSVEFGGAVPAEVPVEAFHAAAPIRTVLTCRCRSGPGHEYRHRQSRRAAGG